MKLEAEKDLAARGLGDAGGRGRATTRVPLLTALRPLMPPQATMIAWPCNSLLDLAEGLPSCSGQHGVPKRVVRLLSAGWIEP